MLEKGIMLGEERGRMEGRIQKPARKGMGPAMPKPGTMPLPAIPFPGL